MSDYKTVDNAERNDTMRRYYEGEVEKWIKQAGDYEKAGRPDLAEQAREAARADSDGLFELTKEGMELDTVGDQPSGLSDTGIAALQGEEDTES